MSPFVLGSSLGDVGTEILVESLTSLFILYPALQAKATATAAIL